MSARAGRFRPKRNIAVTWILALTLLLAVVPPSAAAQKSDNLIPLKQSIQESLQLERRLLEDLEKDRERIRRLEPTLAAELEAYKIMYATYTNMLAQPMPDSEILEQAVTQVKTALIRIREHLDGFNREFNAVRPLRDGLEEQQTTNAAYLEEIRKAHHAEEAVFAQHLQSLTVVIRQKRQYLDEMNDFYQTAISQLSAIQENLLSLSSRLDTRLGESRKSSRLIRRTTLFAPGGRAALIKEADSLFRQMERLLSLPHIENEFALMLKSGGSLVSLPILLFILVMMLAFRLRRHHLKIWKKSAFENCPAFRLAWGVFIRSIFLAVILVSLFIYTRVGTLYVPVHLTILLALLQIYLFTKWGLDVAAGAGRDNRINIQPEFQKRLRALLTLIRCYIMIYVVMSHVSQVESVLLTYGRLVFEVLLIAWCLEFWKTDRRLRPPETTRKGIIIREAGKLLTYLISFGGLAFEIAGYGGLAFFWFTAWGRTLMIGLWAALLFFALRELCRVYQVDPDRDSESGEASHAPIAWLFLKLGQPLVMILSLIVLILAWGGKRDFLVSLFEALRHTYRIGSIEFSIMGFFYALAALLITHIAAQAWRYLFQQKLLARSGMELGLQESLTTISTYLLWALGVLTALNLLGLSTTTLAVAFGALGIGLGFGLQNIFNNFVSGIILLLERPIQVGDDIQVNDTWATVKKINVRSTIVQTYDNASLIIPNSDLISNQVINWSFQDKRLRRSVVIGVAYGSDVELVRRTLLEAAAGIPRVLKQPAPEVIFKDFGDSALVFTLRFWTHIAYFMLVESEVRFAVDRLFRERNISIPFPQRDIHVYQDNKPPVGD